MAGIETASHGGKVTQPCLGSGSAVIGICIGRVVIIDKPKVSTELKSVVVVSPGQIVNHVLNRNGDQGISRFGVNVTETDKCDVGPAPGAAIGISFAGISVSDVVDQVSALIVQLSPAAKPLELVR